MKAIKNAITYKAQLPAAEHLRQNLATMPFAELTRLQWDSLGFVKIAAADDYVVEVPGGLVFAIRYDKKAITPKLINSETEKRIAKLEANECRKVGRKERLAIKETTTDELVAKALTETVAVVHCLYDIEEQLLYLPVSNKQLADRIISRLIHAVGSLRTQTINISDIKMGLTTRLRDWLDGKEEAFGDQLTMGQSVMVTRTTSESSESIAFVMDDLAQADSGLREALDTDFQVNHIRMSCGILGFKLTSDFHLKGISFDVEPDPEAGDDFLSLFKHEAGIQIIALRQVIKALCDLLGYQPPEQEEPHPANVWPAREGDEDDPAYQQAAELVIREQRASIAMVQRVLRIGYNRAARLVETMEKFGIVTPMQPDGNRLVLVKADEQAAAE